MHFLQGESVPCTLLHFVNGELKDVAKGKIIALKSLTVHTRPLDPALFKISLALVLPRYEDLDPPVQPQGAEEHVSLGGCLL
jgi:hypothetical protein